MFWCCISYVYDRWKWWTQINDKDETILMSNKCHVGFRSQKERRRTRKAFSFIINVIRWDTRQYLKLFFLALSKKTASCTLTDVKTMKSLLTDPANISNCLSKMSIRMWQSQLISASIRCGFHVQNPSDADADADLSRDQNYQLL